MSWEETIDVIMKFAVFAEIIGLFPLIWTIFKMYYDVQQLKKDFLSINQHRKEITELKIVAARLDSKMESLDKKLDVIIKQNKI